MIKNTVGERVAKVEVKVDNLEHSVNCMSSKLDDIHSALLGDGMQSKGAISRIQTLEDDKSFGKYIIGLVVSFVAAISGYFAFLR